MGKRSVKAEKSVYQLSREHAGFTRDRASEEMVFVSSDRIEKIENGKTAPHPEEILAMASCYKKPLLCNYYCTQECPIGQKSVPSLESKSLPQIILEMLASLSALEREKDRLIEIAADGCIADDELADFITIQDKMRRVAKSVAALQLWVEEKVMEGELRKEALQQASEG